MNKVFSIKNFVISLAWAKSLTWAVTTDKDKRIYIISLHIITRGNLWGLSLVFGPVAITIGYV